jgi:molybdopterin converting factor small subunit
VVNLRLPAPLRAFTGGVQEVMVEGETVAEVLAALTTKFPPLRRHLYLDDGALRAYVNVFVNDSDVRALAGLASSVRDGDIITIVPSIAGGDACGLERSTARWVPDQ